MSRIILIEWYGGFNQTELILILNPDVSIRGKASVSAKTTGAECLSHENKRQLQHIRGFIVTRR